MKVTSCIAVVIATLCCNSVLGEDDGKTPIRIRPIQILSCDQPPKNVPFEMLPSGLETVDGGEDCEPGLVPVPSDESFFHPVGFQIWYLIEGQDMVCFDSMTLDSISTPDGRDISRYPTGKRSYAVGNLPKTTADGKYCVCSLIVKQNQFGKVEQLSIKGHVTMLTATERKEKLLKLGMVTSKAERAGPFTVEVKPATDPCADYPASVLLDVQITGPIKKLVAVKVTEGDKDLRQLSSRGETGENVTVLKPKSGQFTLKLRYAAELKPVKVALGK